MKSFIGIKIFGIFLFGFILFLLNYVPIKEICSCQSSTCMIHQIYLTRTNEKNFQRNKKTYVTEVTFRRYVNSGIMKFIKLYKVSPIFDSYYLFKFNADKAVYELNSARTVVLVKYNIPYILAFIIILLSLLIPFLIEFSSENKIE